jgi:FkbH-like protein
VRSSYAALRSATHVTDRDRLAADVASQTVASYLATATRLRHGSYDLGGQRPLRLALLRSFTVEPLIPYLEVEAALVGVALETYVGDYGTYRQEILDPESALYDFAPDAVMLMVSRESLVPSLTDDFLLRSPEEIRQAQLGAIADLSSLVEAFRAHSGATLILQTLVPPAHSPAGLADLRLRPGQRQAFGQLNQEIFRLAETLPGVEVFDLDAHVALSGQARWEDPRFEFLARVPIAPDQLPGLARAYARLLGLVANIRRKCVVLDLDNTLWGGVVGEDGWQGIRLGVEYPGSAYVALQRALRDLHRRGILLAIASKNEQSDVDAAFGRSEMILRPEDFAARRVNWRDKATNITEIADELGFGLDALVFIDDSPTERQLVRQLLPDVLVPEWPSEPTRFVEALHAIASLDSLRVTAEDRARGDLYREESRRADARTASRSLDDFHRSLEMRATVDRARPATFARIAQLTQKTNQFNLTLRRHSEGDIAELASSASSEVFVFGLRDRFGDSGQIAVAIIQYEGDVARIDTLLMSCRVLDRGVESFVLAHVAKAARARGAVRLDGAFVAGPRNAQVSDFYPRHGFRAEPSVADHWSLDLTVATVETPSWIGAVEEHQLASAS